RPDDGRDAGELGGADHVLRRVDGDRAVLIVDQHPVESHVAQHLHDGRRRKRDHDAERGLAVPQLLLERVRPHSGPLICPAAENKLPDRPGFALHLNVPPARRMLYRYATISLQDPLSARLVPLVTFFPASSSTLEDPWQNFSTPAASPASGFWTSRNSRQARPARRYWHGSAPTW